MLSHRILRIGDTIHFWVDGDRVNFPESEWSAGGRSVMTNFKNFYRLDDVACKERSSGEFVLNGTTSRATVGGGESFWNRNVLYQFFSNPSQMGEIAPFSSATIDALLAPLVRKLATNARVKVVEVGAGTGGVTRKLVDLKRQYPHTLKVYVVELNEAFQPVLETIIGNSGVKLLMGDYNDVKSNRKIDFIVSTLPEQSLPADLVKALTEKMEKDLKPGGFLTRVRYVLKLHWLTPFFSKQKAQDITEACRVSTEFDKKYHATSELILWNIPPVDVLTIEKPYREV